jgi:copper homeostasis protein
MAVRRELSFAKTCMRGAQPHHGEISLARENLHIKLYVLIRPRGGDFLYDDLEFEIMLTDVKYCIEAGCDGIVTGVLNADGSIDKERSAILVNLAKQAGLGVTFHRAFDMCDDMHQAMEDIIELGCERILTSGGKSTAMEGAHTIANLVKKAAGRIIIMPGSGVNEKNVADLVQYTNVAEVHSSARVRVESKMDYKNDSIIMGDNDDEYINDVTDTERVKLILKLANA